MKRLKVSRLSHFAQGEVFPTPAQAKAREPYEAPACFRIIRFYRNGRKSRTIRNGLTEAQAQAHCSREDTSGPASFDGYDYMKGCRPRSA